VGLKFLLFALIALNLTDNVIGAWLHEQLSSSATAAQVLYIKYIIIAVMFFGFLLDLAYGMKLRRYEWCGLIYLVLVAFLSVGISVTHPGQGAGSRLYLYMFPAAIYFAGMFVGRRSQYGINNIVKYYLISYLAMAGLFLIANLAVGAVQLWRDYLNYAGFILDVKGFTDDAIDGLHGNFYYSVGSVQIPRFVGSFGDPLALSYAGMILIIPTFYLFPKQRLMLCSLIALVIAASLTRAIALVIPLSTGIYWMFREKGYAVTLGMALISVMVVLTFGDAIIALSENSSTNGHVLSISQVFDFLNPVTIVTGSLFRSDLPEFEPGLFNLLFLFGIFPFLLFVMFVRGIYLRNTRSGSYSPYIAIIMLTGILTLSIISSVFFATTSGWFAWFLAGFASKRTLTLANKSPSGRRGSVIGGNSINEEVLA
jgi:hypothetical protein